MRLLILAPRFPYPLDKGDRLTVFHYIKHLSKLHEITLVTFASRHQPEYLPLVRKHCSRLIVVPYSTSSSFTNFLKILPTATPMQIAIYGYQRKMADALAEVLHHSPIDVAYCHTIRMAPYLATFQILPKVLGMQISLALNYRRLIRFSSSPLERLAYTLEFIKVRRYEARTAALFHRVCIISEKDKAELLRSSPFPLTNLEILPHGVDHNYFTPGDAGQRRPNLILMTGNMAYPPNRDAAIFFSRKVFPMILNVEPDAKFMIVGRSPSYSLRQVADGRRIFVTGAVPDIRPYLRTAFVGVVPIRIAAGLQNKLLEGMACALPMVATPCANEGVGAAPGREVLLAEQPQSFAQAVLDLLSSPQTAFDLGFSGRLFVERQFTWEYFIEKLDRILRSAGEIRD